MVIEVPSHWRQLRKSMLHEFFEAAGLHGVEHGGQDVRHMAVEGAHQLEAGKVLGADDLAAVLLDQRRDLVVPRLWRQISHSSNMHRKERAHYAQAP
jgi:hypothetical protein